MPPQPRRCPALRCCWRRGPPPPPLLVFQHWVPATPPQHRCLWRWWQLPHLLGLRGARLLPTKPMPPALRACSAQKRRQRRALGPCMTRPRPPAHRRVEDTAPELSAISLGSRARRLAPVRWRAPRGHLPPASYPCHHRDPPRNPHCLRHRCRGSLPSAAAAAEQAKCWGSARGKSRRKCRSDRHGTSGIARAQSPAPPRRPLTPRVEPRQSLRRLPFDHLSSPL
mmetsp:Transcript_127844/g.331447  ORF Transcript_127844/g.331447 Transcript_127844/m.331447 type:complete len:225 (-) Transcript_127844:58-732(-)